jgi:hypothetical protein
VLATIYFVPRLLWYAVAFYLPALTAAYWFATRHQFRRKQVLRFVFAAVCVTLFAVGLSLFSLYTRWYELQTDPFSSRESLARPWWGTWWEILYAYRTELAQAAIMGVVCSIGILTIVAWSRRGRR